MELQLVSAAVILLRLCVLACVRACVGGVGGTWGACCLSFNVMSDEVMVANVCFFGPTRRDLVKSTLLILMI